MSDTGELLVTCRDARSPSGSLDSDGPGELDYHLPAGGAKPPQPANTDVSHLVCIQEFFDDCSHFFRSFFQFVVSSVENYRKLVVRNISVEFLSHIERHIRIVCTPHDQGRHLELG